MICYSDRELEAMLDDLESDRVERKESFKGDVPRRAREAVCAFANNLPGHSEPGVIFIGARDDGTPSGLVMTDELLLKISDIRSDGKILPLPVMLVEKRHLKGADMVVVTVLPSDMPPVRYDGRIWIRTGPRRDLASAQDEHILNERRRHNNLPFDIFPVTPAKLTDLSRLIFENEYLPMAFAPDVLEANGRSYEERLASCKMIASPDNTTPTVLGLLTLGTSPQNFLPGARIQFLRIDGTDLADDVIDEQDIGGNVSSQLRALNEKIQSYNRIAVDILSGPTHHMTAIYPMAAIEQLVYNAILHRSYENTNAPVRVLWFNDRIEITSPGGPYGVVTCENFGTPGITDYRNPNLASVLKTLGFVQSFGRGILTACKTMELNGNPPPEFQVTINNVLCILRKPI